jgi:hypothetical protein
MLQVGSEEAEKRPKPQSIVLVGAPGFGKTELLERFRGNKSLEYRSDLTVRPLWKLLQKADKGRITHIVLPELQKIFQRKASTSDNMVGTLTQAMEEGVWDVDVGPQHWELNGARLGIIGAMTGRSFRRKRGNLYEMGFLSRVAMLPWRVNDEEVQEIMDRIATGDRRDLRSIDLPVPDKPYPVFMAVKIGRVLAEYTWKTWPDSALRMFQRFRYLTMGAALLDGRDYCQHIDVERGVFQFDDYWHRLQVADALEDDMPVAEN